MAAPPRRSKRCAASAATRLLRIYGHCPGTKGGYGARATLKGRLLSDRYKILIVEDDALIAMELEERLQEMGYDVLGPAATVDEARQALNGRRPDAALLDSNLAGVSSTELAAALAADGVPVAFCTGYDTIKNLPPQLKHAPILTKPIADAELLKVLKQLVS